MMSKVEINWKGNMSFETESNGHIIKLDAGPAVGGNNNGFSPKPLMLISLAGCTGMDVVAILTKMKIEFKSFNIIVEAELTENHPKHYFKLKVVYEFSGTNLDLKKIEKAVKLSVDQYCGVMAVYKKTMEIKTEIKILNE